MPRMSKSQKLEWSFFLNDRGRKAYNTLCRRYAYDCKQSFRRLSLFARIVSRNAPRRGAPPRFRGDQRTNRHSSRITPDQRGCDEKSISN